MAGKKRKGRMGYDGGAAPHGGFSFHARQQAARGAPPPPTPGFFAPFGPPPSAPQPGAAPGFFAAFGAPPPPPGQTPAPQPAREPSVWERMFGRPAEAPKPSAAPATARAAIPAWVKPRVDPSQFFDLQGLYAYVAQQKTDPSFRVPPGSVGNIALLMVARPARDPAQMLSEVASYFRIPQAELQRHGERAWPNLVEPFLKELERALDMQKPATLPGFFRFDFAQDGSMGLAYYERG